MPCGGKSASLSIGVSPRHKICARLPRIKKKVPVMGKCSSLIMLHITKTHPVDQTIMIRIADNDAKFSSLRRKQEGLSGADRIAGPAVEQNPSLATHARECF